MYLNTFPLRNTEDKNIEQKRYRLLLMQYEYCVVLPKGSVMYQVMNERITYIINTLGDRRFYDAIIAISKLNRIAICIYIYTRISDHLDNLYCGLSTYFCT